MLSLIESTTEWKFDPTFDFEIGVKPDGIDPNKKVVVEVYAHMGAVKGAQRQKIKADILKLAYIEKMKGEGWKKVMCFGCDAAASYVKNDTWAAKAATAFGIEIVIVPLTAEQKAVISAAQARQKMVNAE